jgi:hypothetical protein
VGPEDWVRELSQYDAGWLHRFTSDNCGDLRRATWDDLNSPARLPVLMAAGVPPLQQANPGSRVATERILRDCGAGICYDGLDDLVDRLRAEVASGASAATTWAARGQFTYDAHADRLVDVYRAAAARTSS